MAGDLSSDFDEHFAVLHDGRVGLDRDHARRRHYLAGLDVELAVMKIALNDVAIDKALGQRARTMGTGVVGDVVLAVKIEYRDGQAAGFHPERVTGGNLIGFAEFDAGWHRFLLPKGDGVA